MTYFDALFLLACICLFVKDLFIFYAEIYHHHGDIRVQHRNNNVGKFVWKTPKDYITISRIKKKKK